MCPWPTDLRAVRVRAVVPMGVFVEEEDVPDIPQPALLAAAAGESAVDGTVENSSPAAGEEPAKTTTMEADRHRRCRRERDGLPPTATAWPGCPTPDGAWSVGGRERPGRPGRQAWRRRQGVEGRAGVDRLGGRAAEVA